MKKSIINFGILVASITILCGFDSASEEENRSSNIEDYQLIDASEIPSGKYSDTEVALEGVIDNHTAGSDNCSFTLWIKSGDTYLYDDGFFYGIEEGSPEEIFQNAKDGDIVHFATKIYDDNSFGPTTVYAAEIVGSADLISVYDSYKASCSQIDYDGASRNPDQYEGSKCFVSGTIFQVVNEGSSSAEYIVETADGLVYLNWYENEDTRGSRFLEGDSVNIYGQYDGLETYDSLVKENTIPRVIVNLIELI